MSNEPFVWKDIEKNISLSKQLQCQAKNAETEDPFFIRVSVLTYLLLELVSSSRLTWISSSNAELLIILYNVHVFKLVRLLTLYFLWNLNITSLSM